MTRITIHIICLLTLWVISVSASYSQEVTNRYLKFDALTINDGLSQGMINCIMQDSYGFMWFGTKDGLNRYDGYHFIIYRHDGADSNSLSDNYVQHIYEDSKGRLWVATANRGIDLFNRETETFLHINHDTDKKNMLSENWVEFMVEDRNGALWVDTDKGLSKIWFEESKDHMHSGFPFSIHIKHYLKDFVRLMATNNDYIWGVSDNIPFFRILPDVNNNEVIEHLDSTKFYAYPGSQSKFVYATAEDTARRKFYLIQENYVTVIDTRTGIAEVLFEGGNRWSVMGRTNCVDASQNIWVSNDRRGFEQFNVVEKKWYRLRSHDQLQDNMLLNASVTFRDRSGIIWIGTKGFGVLKFNPQAEKFHPVNSESINWMSPAREGKAIICKMGTFLSIFDPTTHAYTMEIADSQFHRSGVRYSQIGRSTCALQDGTGQFWLTKGWWQRYDQKNDQFTTVRQTDPNYFPVFIDRSQQVWSGSLNRLTCYDPITHKFTDYQYPFVPLWGRYDFLQCMYQDEDGIFWLGTTKGLFRFDPQRPEWKQYKNVPDDTTSISFDIIFTICPDPANPEEYLWIGTDGGGINRFSKQTGESIRYAMKDGLPNDVVYGILSDEEGNLWMSTNDGLCRFNPVTKAIKTFRQKDGLQGNEFNRYAYCKLENGWLFFGGVNGFNYFNPKELHDNPFIPQVQITGFKLRNKSNDFSEKNSALSKPIYLTEKITLPHSDNMITFEFASMDFAAPGKNLYKYKLEGFDHDWIQSGDDNDATYTNLDPGSYTFNVKGSNNDGIWNETPRQLQLIILPPWYMTWWFRTFTGIVVLSILYGIYRYRLQQALHVQAVRNRIARDLHDEIGANLSSISIFSEVAGEKANDQSPELGGWLKKINEHTQSSMEAMSDIVWVINSRNDRFGNVISRMRSLAAELFEARNCELTLQLDESLSDLKLDMETRKNFYLIYKEALNNIAKYADCDQVKIELKWNHHTVLLSISDNGKGFNESLIEHGNGLLNMKKRAEELKGKLVIHSAEGQGTRVKLEFGV